MTVVWRRFGADVGDEKEELSERAAQKRVDTRFDKLLIFKTRDGKSFTTANVVHEKSASAADAEAKKTRKKVRKLLKEKKVEEVVEIAPVAGG